MSRRRNKIQTTTKHNLTQIGHYIRRHHTLIQSKTKRKISEKSQMLFQFSFLSNYLKYREGGEIKFKQTPNTSTIEKN